MTSFMLSIGQKILKFWKVISENLKNRENFRSLSQLIFSKVICKAF